jgi:hypothetical protein
MEDKTERNPKLRRTKKAEFSGLDPRRLVTLNVGQSNGTRIVAAFVLETELMIRMMRKPLKRV